MRYTYPDYYNSFTCIADKCEATCCAGWQIVIDEASLKRYKKICKNKPDSRIDWESSVFCQTSHKRCAFLNSQNLCNMYLEWGADALCDTCKNYPRHMEEFENIREYTLSISCPEVARIILGNKSKVNFISKEDDTEEFEDDFDVLLFSLLEDVRQLLFEILQNRNLSISERICFMLQIGTACQNFIDENNIFAINDLLTKYKNLEQADTLIPDTSYQLSLSRFQQLYEMEILNESWADLTDETAAIIYGKGAQAYQEIQQNFSKWMDENIPEHEIIWEQILVYFIATYFCGAVYDDFVIGKVDMAVTSLVCIYQMLAARWLKQENHLDFDDIVELTYLYSRELEHSDINLNLF